jgi:hypothetical protein
LEMVPSETEQTPPWSELEMAPSEQAREVLEPEGGWGPPSVPPLESPHRARSVWTAAPHTATYLIEMSLKYLKNYK